MKNRTGKSNEGELSQNIDQNENNDTSEDFAYTLNLSPISSDETKLLSYDIISKKLSDYFKDNDIGRFKEISLLLKRHIPQEIEKDFIRILETFLNKSSQEDKTDFANFISKQLTNYSTNKSSLVTKQTDTIDSDRDLIGKSLEHGKEEIIPHDISKPSIDTKIDKLGKTITDKVSEKTLDQYIVKTNFENEISNSSILQEKYNNLSKYFGGVDQGLNSLYSNQEGQSLSPAPSRSPSRSSSPSSSPAPSTLSSPLSSRSSSPEPS